MRWIVACSWLVAAAGCGRVGFDARGTGDGSLPDGTIGDGGGPDVAFGNCWSAWTTGPLTLGSVRELSELNTLQDEGDPFLTDDGLTLYFVRGGVSGGDIYVATRPTRASLFGAPVLAADVNDALADDSKLSIGDGGLRAVIASKRATSADYDLWELARTNIGDPFGPATNAPFAALNTSTAQFDPHLTADGLRLYYAPGQPGGQAASLATRATVGDPFGLPQPIVGLVGNDTADPTLSPDELVIVYSARKNTVDPLSMFYAVRSSPTASFTAAQPVPAIQWGGYDGDAHLAGDGCELLFASTRTGGAKDLFLAVVQ
ncbi:MAG TPA: hypothetical protein VFQ53_07405 [Kofleriaceae bacterium]|nr:hypothetical protein [Kofleriaceae bacterium]